jgi:SSS family solute:Na+ symporter
MTPLIVIICYLVLLLGLGLCSSRFFRGTSKDYFVASHSIGPFLLLMSVFGTTMTAFALVGSTGKAFERGIGVYGLMASSSGLIHAACFFLIGVRLWVFGKKYGYVTQIQFFRDRFESESLGYLLFPILVGLVIPYLLIGVIGAGKTIQPVTAGAFPALFPNEGTPWPGGIPPWLTGLVVCGVVLMYVFAGGSRAAAWANTFQTLVFMAMGLVAFVLIARNLGGLANASQITLSATEDGKLVQTHRWDSESRQLAANAPPKTVGSIAPGGQHSGVVDVKAAHRQLPPRPTLTRTVATATFAKRNPVTKKPVLKDGKPLMWEREYGIPPLMFFTYMFIPLSVGMFPHLFQHWLTAKSAKTFRLTLIAHPLCIMIVWVPCVLIGAWAAGILSPAVPPAAVLGRTVATLVGNPYLIGLLTAGILAAIMSSLDSQFHCLGTIFTNDIVLRRTGSERFTDRQVVWMARGFTIGIVAVTYLLAMIAINANVFDLAVWCFTGFAALTPLVIAALYWRRATKAGAFASVIAVVATWTFFFVKASIVNQSLGGEYTVWGGVMPVALCFAAGVTAMIIVSLVTRPPDARTLDKFFPEKAA